MDELRKIAYNCRKATFLIEKQHIGRISAKEKLEIKIHLAGCSICRTFEKQSLLINRMVKGLLDSSQPGRVALDEDFKAKLQQKIDTQFKGQ